MVSVTGVMVVVVGLVSEKQNTQSPELVLLTLVFTQQHLAFFPTISPLTSDDQKDIRAPLLSPCRSRNHFLCPVQLGLLGTDSDSDTAVHECSHCGSRSLGWHQHNLEQQKTHSTFQQCSKVEWNCT